MRFPVQRDEASAAFFDAAKEHRLLIKRSADGRFFAPQAVFDPADPAEMLEWTVASGTGSLVSWIVGRAKPDEAGVQRVTSVGGLVALDEGPWLIVPIQSDDVTALRAGIRLSVTFPEPESGECIPVFAPVE